MTWIFAARNCPTVWQLPHAIFIVIRQSKIFITILLTVTGVFVCRWRWHTPHTTVFRHKSVVRIRRIEGRRELGESAVAEIERHGDERVERQQQVHAREYLERVGHGAREPVERAVAAKPRHGERARASAAVERPPVVVAPSQG